MMIRSRSLWLLCGAASGMSMAGAAMSQTIGFAEPITVPLGDSAAAVCAADFDGDGRQDIAALRFDGVVKVMGNNGNGTFSELASIQVMLFQGEIPSVIRAGDLNGDGRPDIVVAGFSLPVHLIMNQSHGLFGQPVNTCFIGQVTPKLKLADVNNDGRLDVILNNPASIMISSTSGFPSQFVMLPGCTPDAAIAVADFNNDGLKDLAITNTSAPYGVRLMRRNSGAGISFTQVGFLPATDTIDEVSAGDLNGDGKPDLALVRTNMGTIETLMATGSMAFAAPVSRFVGSGARTVELSDLNGDNTLDLLADCNSLGTVAVRLGCGGGAFGANSMFGAPQACLVGSQSAADMNGDGLKDLLFVGGGSVLILRNASQSGAACPADFDKDGTVAPADVASFVNTWLSSFSGGGCP